ncbi:insulin-like growth factor-binding protein-related 1 [Octopus vulgaris]|uniref:Insulin-like growth factor-binding protein-related 1 n=2 Tax=Octopus TaxID=6643 RepID=A0AA36BF92_OCTVU|nr:insulin-like growth factor-binding protein-related protein 1 [Octopus sinensis]CAI9732974.1 insulin-like growth factor-binding protein-related 1 [Octopus vulgaris]
MAKLVWILGLSWLCLLLVSSSPVNEEIDGEDDYEDEEEEHCNPGCIKECARVKRCRAEPIRDSCGCCVCAEDEDPSPAVIKSGPEHTSNRTGGIVVLSCEVMGNPVPNVIWMKTNVNNKTIQVPDDDSSISSLIRGGPEPHEKTAWIQIINVRKVHEADYTCVAFNELGKDKATARIKVKDGEHKKRRTKRRNPDVN